MKLKIINPDYGMTKEELAQRLTVLKQIVQSDTMLDMSCLTKNQVVISSAFDVTLAGSEIITLAKQAQSEGYDAVVIYCFSDPALVACREMLTIPVFGAGQCAFLAAANLGYHLGLLVSDSSRIPEKKLFVHTTGIAPERLVAVVSADLDMINHHVDTQAAVDKLCVAGEKAIACGAQVLILGCLSFLGLADLVSKRLNVPVIDPAKMAVATAEMMVRQNLTVSKYAYPYPKPGKRSWMADAIEL